MPVAFQSFPNVNVHFTIMKFHYTDILIIREINIGYIADHKLFICKIFLQRAFLPNSYFTGTQVPSSGPGSMGNEQPLTKVRVSRILHNVFFS